MDESVKKTRKTVAPITDADLRGVVEKKLKLKDVAAKYGICCEAVRQRAKRWSAAQQSQGQE